jgi:oligopeptide transport system permease protein
LIADGAPVSLRLGLSAILIATGFGMLLGTFAALRQNNLADYSVMTIAMLGITIPSFVMAPILTLIFGVYLGWLPVAGWEDGALKNMILPVVGLALPQIAVISRLTRGGMIEVLRSNYVRTARAKGLPERLVITRHALRSALLPLVSYLGPATAGIVTGSLVIEQIYGLPGIGRYFINGALQRDYTLVMGVVILYATLVIMLNLVADVIYGLLDPKVRYD